MFAPLPWPATPPDPTQVWFYRILEYMDRPETYLGQDGSGRLGLFEWAGPRYDNPEGELWIFLPLSPEQFQAGQEEPLDFLELQENVPWWGEVRYNHDPAQPMYLQNITPRPLAESPWGYEDHYSLPLLQEPFFTPPAGWDEYFPGPTPPACPAIPPANPNQEQGNG